MATKPRSARVTAGGASPLEGCAGCGLVLAVGDGLFSRRVGEAVRACGASLRQVDDPAEPARLRPAAQGRVALVWLGQEPSPNAPALATVRRWCEHGFIVIACADGAERWPVGKKCLPLVAGAVELLDVAANDFDARLQVRLKQSLESAATAQAEEQRIREIMTAVGVVGESAAMLSVIRAVARLSGLSDVPVLLTGETGTGKGLLARAIHSLDPKRRAGPFVALNCGAVSAGLAESELFGHRRGAFTGADRDRKGLFRAAEGGVLFLDEIGDMDQTLQVKLLRVLQEGRVLGVGEDAEAPVNVRVIAATNRDLSRMVADKLFRADLFHRLNVLQVEVPPLRDRPADVAPLIFHLLEKHRALGPGEAIAPEPDFVEALGKIELPGNVRQLEHIICQTLVNKRPGSSLQLNDLPAEVWRQLSDPRGASDTGRAETAGAPPAREPAGAMATLAMRELDGWTLARFLDRCERLLLERALQQTRGNQAKTARLLGITPRSVYNKLRKHRLRVGME